MPNYIGDEINNPILNFIQAQINPSSGASLEIPHLRDAYKLWNAGKQQVVSSLLPTPEAQTWFGHSLFTTNVKMYSAYLKLFEISHIFSPDPMIPRVPTPNNVTYEAPAQQYPEPLKQIKRYDVIDGFFSDLMGALDMMSVGMAYLYDFDRIVTCLGLKGDFTPDRMDIGKTLQFVRKVQNATPNPACNIPTNFIQLMQQKNLHQWNSTTQKTGCQWYDNLSLQRNYNTHVGFPMFYVENGEWKLSADPRGAAPDANLTDRVPLLCQDIFDNTHRFLGEVYEAVWKDFGHLLP